MVPHKCTFFSTETVMHYVVQSGLELAVLLPQRMYNFYIHLIFLKTVKHLLISSIFRVVQPSLPSLEHPSHLQKRSYTL
jgi:hypothetical protein